MLAGLVPPVSSAGTRGSMLVPRGHSRDVVVPQSDLITSTSNQKERGEVEGEEEREVVHSEKKVWS